MNHLPTLQVPVRGQPLLLYLASNSQVIRALLAQKDDEGNEKPIYYVSRALKDIETRYPKRERVCLVVIYASQRLKHYFSAYQILLVTKSHPIKSLLHHPLLTGRVAQWLVLLSQYNIGLRTLRAVKSQAIVELSAQFPREEECPLSEEILGEVVVAELSGRKWTMRFDGLATTASNGIGVVLSCEDGDIMPLSFKFDFLYLNNAAEYEAYLIGLAIALSMGIKHMRVLGDSNIVVSQVKGDFALREQSLASYQTWAQKVEGKFHTFSVKYTQRSENRFTDTLATLGSQIPFKGESTLIKVSKQQNSIVGTLKRMFPEESKKEDWRNEIKREMRKLKRGGSIKELKDYTLIEGELYKRLPGGILSKCINEKEGKLKLEELHRQIYGAAEKISLYRRMQCMGYYWPNMRKKAAIVQEKCQNCQLSVDKE